MPRALRLALAAAAALALGSAWLAVRTGLSGGEVSNGPWRTSLTTGSPDADLYTRARVAVGGLLALSPEETIYWNADVDNERAPLDARCTYRVKGDELPALTAPYTSLSGFARNTDNFFALNDRTAGAAEIDVVVVGPGTPRDGLEAVRVVESPSDRGVLLVRRVVPDAAALAAIDEARQGTRAELW